MTAHAKGSLKKRGIAVTDNGPGRAGPRFGRNRSMSKSDTNDDSSGGEYSCEQCEYAGETQRGLSSHISHVHDRDDPLNEDELRELWYDETLRRADIADEIGYHEESLDRLRERYGLPTREEILADELQQFDPWHKLDRPIVLYDLYFNRELTYKKIGEMAGLKITGVQYWMRKHGFEGRRSHYRESHPQWKGEDHDRSYYYGPNWHERRAECIIRDGGRCRRCGVSEPAYLKETGLGLDAHHVAPFGEFDGHEEANELSNLITLCRSCHSHMEGIPIDNRHA